jgi:hypothetical protein
MKYEYQLEPLSGADADLLERSLNQLGAEGWQIVHVAQTSALNPNYIVWMMKEVAE